jgi:GntR family transcriptional repressor for pyruvate dehydrogenase complex
MADALRPVKRTRLYEEVADRLREFIDDEALGPGDRLPSEREIASRLEVSRTSVRQALTTLKATGLIEMRHGDGAYLVRSSRDIVPTLASELLRQYERLPAIMEVREALETENARLAARRRTNVELTEMRAALAQMRAAIERGRPGIEGDARFHKAVARAAHNDLLLALMRQLTEPIDSTRRASLSLPGRPAQSLAAHHAIVEAIEAGDEDAAARAMREHLRVVASVAFVSRNGDSAP